MTMEVALSEADARYLTDRIKVAVEGAWLIEAYTTRAYGALGYDSWASYCVAEFGNARLRLPRKERQKVVASLRDSGLSVRAIASAIGVSTNTVMKDIRAAVRQPDTEPLAEERQPPMNPLKTIGPPIIDRRGRQMPQRAQRKAISEVVSLITGACIGISRLDDIDEAIDTEEAAQWVRDLSESLRVLRSLNNKLKEHANGTH